MRCPKQTAAPRSVSCFCRFARGTFFWTECCAADRPAASPGRSLGPTHAPPPRLSPPKPLLRRFVHVRPKHARYWCDGSRVAPHGAPRGSCASCYCGAHGGKERSRRGAVSRGVGGCGCHDQAVRLLARRLLHCWRREGQSTPTGGERTYSRTQSEARSGTKVDRVPSTSIYYWGALQPQKKQGPSLSSLRGAY